MNRRFEKKNKRKARSYKPSILIAAEGEHITEQVYIGGFRSYECPYNIRFVPGRETDPISLIDNLNNAWKKDGYDEDFGDLKIVVIDLDNSKEKATLLQDLIQEHKDIEFIISNPTFEIWYMFHFEENPKRYLKTKELINDLQRYIKDYKKSGNFNDVLYPRTETAIKNCKNKEINQNDLYFWPDVDCNPRTDMHSLVEILHRKTN